MRLVPALVLACSTAMLEMLIALYMRMFRLRGHCRLRLPVADMGLGA